MKIQYKRPELSIENYIVKKDINNFLSVIKDYLNIDEDENYDGIIWED